MRLSNRLETIINMIGSCNVISDIGCDHGLLAIEMIRRGICNKVIATDIGIGPLESALKNVREQHLEDRVELRLSDGLNEIRYNEADAAVIAGMGGLLIARILDIGKDKLSGMKELVIEPQSSYAIVRRTVEKIGFAIIDEEIVRESNKYYPVIRCYNKGYNLNSNVINHYVYPNDNRVLRYDIYQDIDYNIFYEYGQILLDKKHPLLIEYLNKQVKTYENILANNSHFKNNIITDNTNELSYKLNLAKKALCYMDIGHIDME